MNSDSDLLSILPEASAAKLARLLDARTAAHEATLAAGDRFREALEDFQWIGRHRKAVEHRGSIEAAHSTYFPHAAKAIDPADHELIAAKNRVDRARAARDAATAAWEQHAFLDRVTKWLRTWAAHGGNLVHRDLPEVRLARGETHHEAVARIRAQIGEVDIEWVRIENAPQTLDDLKAEVVAQVDKIAAKGQPRFLTRDAPLHPDDLESTIRSPRILPRAPINLDELLYLRDANGRVVAHPTPFMFWFDRDRIVERLCVEAEKLNFSEALDNDARERAFLRLLDQRLALAWQEEAAIEAAAAGGTVIGRRPDSDPRPILQISERVGHGASSEGERPARGSAPAHRR